MRATQLYAPTLRESPAEAELISHKLMYRAGLIRKAAGGLYSYLPLGWRTMKKIMQIFEKTTILIMHRNLNNFFQIFLIFSPF